MSVIQKYLELNYKVDQTKIVDFGEQTPEFYALTDYIETLTDAERIEVRTHLEALKIPAPRSLYYNYITQNWIN